MGWGAELSNLISDAGPAHAKKDLLSLSLSLPLSLSLSDLQLVLEVVEDSSAAKRGGRGKKKKWNFVDPKSLARFH